MVKMNIEIFKANEGDAFLISIFGNYKKYNILIDGGRKITYQSFIEKKLKDISLKGEFIDLLIVSHIDNDHIEGIREFISKNGFMNSPKVIKINEVWHNSYRHLQFNKKKQNSLGEIEKEILESKCINMNRDIEDNHNNNKEIGFFQGSSLANLLYQFGYNWNKSFENGAVCVENLQTVYFGDVKITLLSPNKDKLNALSQKWLDDLKKDYYGFKLSDDKIFDDAFEFSLANKKILELNEAQSISDNDQIDFDDFYTTKVYNDKSETNGSSISIVLEFENKKILFLGDSHSDIILNNIIKYCESNKCNFFDAIKISHHGSKRNTTKELLEIIDSSKYIITTNGRYNHPSLSVLAHIVKRKNDIHRTLIFNYDHHGVKTFNRSDWMKKYNYSILVCSENETLII